MLVLDLGRGLLCLEKSEPESIEESAEKFVVLVFPKELSLQFNEGSVLLSFSSI